MRSDVKALIKVFLWSFLVAALVMGVALVSVLAGLNRDYTVYVMLGVMVCGVLLVTWRLGPALLRRGGKEEDASE